MNTQYTDSQLKQALAKMLPNALFWDNGSSPHTDIEPDDAWGLCWDYGNPVLDSELLHLCWLVEETLTEDEFLDLYVPAVASMFEGNPFKRDVLHLAWQQRTIALAKVKGVRIV